MRVDIAIDVETLSTRNNPVILQVAAVAFDIKTGKTLREFKLEIDMQSCIDSGLHIDKQTLAWWMKQDSELIKTVMGGTQPLKNVLKALTEWIHLVSGNRIGIVYLWGNGILADNTWLKSAYESQKMSYPIHYKNDRDIRTLLDLASNKIDQDPNDIMSRIKVEGAHHNALTDARWAALLITNCWNLINQ